MNKLKELRHALKLTQREMANFLNVSFSLYQKMEIGNKNISISTFKSIKNKEAEIRKKIPLFDYKIFLEEIITKSE